MIFHDTVKEEDETYEPSEEELEADKDEPFEYDENYQPSQEELFEGDTGKVKEEEEGEEEEQEEMSTHEKRVAAGKKGAAARKAKAQKKVLVEMCRGSRKKITFNTGK